MRIAAHIIVVWQKSVGLVMNQGLDGIGDVEEIVSVAGSGADL